MLTENDLEDRVAYLHNMTKELVNRNLEEEEIIARLKKEGVDDAYARQLIENVLTDKRDRKDAHKLLLMGLVLTIGGIAANIYSYNRAVATKQTSFIIIWGIAGIGIIALARAIFLYRK